jgi:hypothetical protein
MIDKTKYYQRVEACVNYKTYQFALPKILSNIAYTQLRNEVSHLGENSNPTEIIVLHIKQTDFFIDFPAQGFPYFKISFYHHATPETIAHYLNYLNTKLDTLLLNK